MAPWRRRAVAATGPTLQGCEGQTPTRISGGLMSTRVMPSIRPLRDRPAWKALEKHYEDISGKHLRELFASDPTRGERLTVEGAGLFLDYSKNRITDETVQLLGALAEQSGIADRTEAMFAGEHINVSEDREVLHV